MARFAVRCWSASRGRGLRAVILLLGIILSGWCHAGAALADVSAPVVSTGLAADILPREATLIGTVNPNGADTTYHFEYGPTTTYGSSTPTGDAGSGEARVTVRARATSLTPGVTYHYRLVGSSAIDTRYGADNTFTTPLEFILPRFTGAGPIVSGPDGNLWFLDSAGGNAESVGKITTSGAITKYSLPTHADTVGLAAGPDGNLWFTENSSGRVATITPAGVITTYALPSESHPTGIIAGPDGNMWYLNVNIGHVSYIGKITTGGVITQYPFPDPENQTPGQLTVGPDHNIWVTISGFTGEDQLAKVTLSGDITEYPSGHLVSATTGSDGKLWFTRYRSAIATSTTSGVFTAEYPLSPESDPGKIAASSAGDLWFTENTLCCVGPQEFIPKIGKITTKGAISEYSIRNEASPDIKPGGLTEGPDGDMWYTAYAGAEEHGIISKIIPKAAPAAVLTGQPGWYGLEDEELSTATMASVNVAGGNLLIANEDLAPVKATSYVRLGRFYNSQASSATGTLGPRWSWNAGPAVYLTDAGQSVVVHGPSGYVVTLTRQPDATYSAPEEFEGTLTKNSDGTYALAGVERATYKFNSAGAMTGYSDEEGHSFTVSDTMVSGVNALHSVTASSGKTLEVAYDGTPHVTQTTDPAGKVRLYAYNAAGQLSSYTEPSGKKDEYGYDANGYLNRIALSNGFVETITTVGGKVTEVSVKQKAKAAASETFAYQAPSEPTCNPETDAGETVVTHQPEGGTPETFCYDAFGEITAYSGPEDEADNEEGTEPQEEVPAGTCYASPEFPEKYCGEEDPPPENEESGASTGGAALEEAMQPQAASIPDLGPTHYGIADNNKLTGTPHFNYFTNSYFKVLHVVNVRRTVPWNLVPEANSGDAKAQALLSDVKTWVEKVKLLSNSTGQPLVSFDRCPENETSVDPAHKEGPRISCDTPPTVGQYEEATREFRADAILGQVKYFTAWNEPNRPPGAKTHKGQEPTWNAPELAGKYWQALENLCKPLLPKTPARCLVAAGDFLDSKMPNVGTRDSKGGEYFHKYWLGMGHPKTGYRWAWHAYTDGERAGTVFRHRPAERWKRFKNFHNEIDTLTEKYRPDIWLTEQGVEFLLGGARQPASYCGCTATAIMHAYVEDEGNQLTRQSRQITRFYYYQVRGDKVFDSGLLALTSSPRKIYYIYRHKTPTK
jgi:YD repeat-containing protein